MTTATPKSVANINAERRAAIGFILRLARALHTYGIPAHSLEDVLGQASERLRLTGQFFSTPTSIFASFGAQEEQQTFLLRVEPGRVDLGKIADLDDVTTGVLRGALDPATGSADIDRVLAAAPRYGHWVTTLAYGVASAAAARFLGGGVKEIIVSAALGLVIGLLLVSIDRYPAWGRVFEPLAAFTASALATALSFVIGAFAVSNATLAGLIVLMPGLTLTVAMVELSSQHLSSGTARLSRAFVILMELGFGAALGGALINSLLGAPRIARVVPLPAWTELLALIVMSLAFTVLLRAHLRDAVWIIVAGALSLGGARVGVKFLGPEIGVFLGALIVGVASNWYARLLDRPAIITQVPGILLLVPGSVGFRALAALLDQEVISGVETTFKMILTAAALVSGTLIAGIIAPSRREI